MNKMVWQDVITELKPSFANRILQAIDLPGYGENRDIASDYSLDSMADWLANQIEHKVILVGWSLGGLLALHLAKHFPKKVKQVFLIASSPKFTESIEWPGIKPELLIEFHRQLERDHKSLIERFFFIQAMGSQTAKQDIKRIKEQVFQLPTPKLEALSAGLNILSTADHREFLTHSSVDIKLLLGKLDSLVPLRQSEQLTKINPNIEVKIIDKASHAPFISHLSQVTAWLRQSFT